MMKEKQSKQFQDNVRKVRKECGRAIILPGGEMSTKHDDKRNQRGASEIHKTATTQSWALWMSYEILFGVFQKVKLEIQKMWKEMFSGMIRP